MHSTPLLTLTQFVLESQPAHASGDLTLVLSALQTACKRIASLVRRVGLLQLTGLAGSANASNDDMKKLDVLSNDIVIDALRGCGRVAGVCSEEEESYISFGAGGKYVVVTDPLDGSSNIDCNVSVGSIIGIYARPAAEAAAPSSAADVLQPGRALVCAAYCMYGSATDLVLNLGVGAGVHAFSLDPAIGEFLMTRRDIKIPAAAQRIYSINEGNARTFSPGVKAFLEHAKAGEKPYSARYTGSMVADVHRTLLYGGIFIYPASSSAPSGKLRLLYEVNPMARIFEESGGRAICAAGASPLDLVPATLHQRAPCILGCARDVDMLEAMLAAEAK